MDSPGATAAEPAPHLRTRTNLKRWMACIVTAGLTLGIVGAAEPARAPSTQVLARVKRLQLRPEFRVKRAPRTVPGERRIAKGAVALQGAILPPGSTAAAAGGGCTWDIECDDGDACTTDHCAFIPGNPPGSGFCDYALVPDGSSGGCAAQDGEFCNGKEICTGHGVCNTTTGMCEGDGASGACTNNNQCTGRCVAGLCAGGPNPGSSCQTSMDCRNAPAACGPPPAGERPSNYCTTVACTNGRCVGGPDHGATCSVVGDCESFTTGVCDEFRDACAEACIDSADCNARDGLLCNGTETCAGGVCEPGTNPCGPGAACLEGVCTGTLLPCSRNSECPSGQTCSLAGPGCYGGRCCFTFVVQPETCTANDQCPSGVCDVPPSTCRECIDTLRRTSAQGPSQVATDQCEEKGGIWYPTDTGRPLPAASTTCAFPAAGCPAYSGGIAPYGDLVDTIGPVSGSPVAVDPPAGPGQPFTSVGDDYDTGEPGVVHLAALRWVGGADAYGEARFEFYDPLGRFVDAAHSEVGPGIMVRPVLFDPPLLIPPDGFVVARVAADVSPNLRLFWASTDAVDVGSNDPGVLVSNDCHRDCDLSDCTNFVTPNAGILAFELVLSDDDVGAYVGDACCNAATHTCDYEYSWECVDGACVGGENDCRPCSDDGECPDGSCMHEVHLGPGSLCGSCEADSADPFALCASDSECQDVAFPEAQCLPRCESGACCLDDGTCVAGSTDTDCASLSGEFLGFGSDCVPDCCARPLSSYTGGDDCQDAIVHAVTVPQFDVCVGGTNDGQACSTTLDCPGGLACRRRRIVTITGDNSAATATSADPDSCFGFAAAPTDNRGWWEAFEIDACAFVRLDFCCASSAVQSADDRLYDTCPCSAPTFAISNPEGSGLGLDAPPLCRPGQEAWAWFGPLTPGVYYYPIPSSQLPPGGPYQLHITVDACPEAACCNGTECSVANIIDCEAGGGFYVGPPNKVPLEPACVPNSPNFCPTGSPDCCELGGLNPGTGCGTCQTGSCCGPAATGPGTCDDQAGVELMSEPACNAAGGTFTGGVRCKGGTCSNNPIRSCVSTEDCSIGIGAPCIATEEQLSQPTPCPLCDIDGPGNCHERTPYAVQFDVSEYTLAELTVADDFIPLDDTISRLCTSGLYISTVADADDPATGCRFRVYLSMPDPLDKFRVRIYQDGADDDNPSTPPFLPGDLFAERFASSTGDAWMPAPPRVEGIADRQVDLDGPNTALFGDDDLTDEIYRIDLSDDPITGLQLDGRRYWLEIMNNMDVSPIYEGEPSCIWFINHARFGNEYAAAGAAGSFAGAGSFDLTFCIDSGFTEPGPPTGACCVCGACTDDTTTAQCAAENGMWFAGEDCAAIVANGECAVSPPNDECAGAVDITDFGDPIAGTVTFSTNHFCATTSLPDVTICSDFTPPQNCESQCGDPDADWIGNDLWFKYVAPEDGELLVNTCQTGTIWDSMFALYQGPVGTGECPCPTDVTSCETLAFPGADGATACDEGCQAVPGSACITTRQLQSDTCYLIQFGSWGPTLTTPGAGILSLRHARSIVDQFPPEPCANDFAAATDGAGGERLSRFGCVSPPDPPVVVDGGEVFAVQVRLMTLYNTGAGDPDGAEICPTGRTGPSLDPFEGEYRYLGEPMLAVDESLPPAPDYIVAPLVCDPAEAAIRDWSLAELESDFPTANPEAVYFFGPELVPCSVYEVSFCTYADPSSCGDVPLAIRTCKLGDAWPPFGGVGQPNYADISALVNKYKGIAFQPGAVPLGGAPEWHALLRSNVVAEYDVTTANKKVNFQDIGHAVNGYKLVPYNLPGPAPCNP